MPLTYVSSPRMTTRGVIVVVTPKSKQRDRTLQRCAGRSVGSEPVVVQVPRGCVLASSRTAVTSRIGLGAGTSRDGR
jgi:hypothetical protein